MHFLHKQGARVGCWGALHTREVATPFVGAN